MGFSKYFWLTSVLFAINQCLEALDYHLPIVHAYLDDVLCPGIVLGFALFVQQQFTFRNPQHLLTRGNILFFVFWYSFLFELLFPILDDRHHADPLDILAYAIGSYLFYKFGNKEASRILFSGGKKAKAK